MQKMSFRYQLLTFLIIFALVGLFVGTSISQEKLSAENYFEIAEGKYIEGQTEKAIIQVKKCLQLNPHHKVAKILLDMILDELSFKYYTQQNYVKALPYLEELYKLHPDNKEIEEMYEYAKREISRAEKESLPGVGQRKESKEIKKKLSVLESRYRKLTKLFDEYKYEQELTTKKMPVITETLSSRLEEIENSMKNYSGQISIDMETERIKLRKIYTYGPIISLFGFFMLIGWIIVRKRYESKYQVQLLRQIEQKISTKGAMQKADIIPSTYKSILQKKPGLIPGKITGNILKELTSEKKIQMVKVIEDEISKTENSKMGINLLKPFLDDIDIFVRLEALKVLYGFDKYRSLKTLELLVKDKDSNVRLKTATILGKIATAESLSILLGMVYDTDIGVRKAVIKKLNEVKNKKIIPSEVFNEKLEYLLNEIRKRERWIIE